MFYVHRLSYLFEYFISWTKCDRYLVKPHVVILVIHTSDGTNKKENTGDTPSRHTSSYVSPASKPRTHKFTQKD